MQRVRLRYTKRGRLRFTSHRDIGRALERAVRRAGIPVAYSHGFNPHPRISYAGASPTGAASEAEYLEIGLHRRCDPEDVRVALDGALPDGIDVIGAAEAAGGSLTDHLEASDWEMSLPGVEEELARTAVGAFLTAESVEVSRMTKKGLRTFDCRAAVVRMSVASTQSRADGAPCAILRVVIRHGTPSVRPDDVLAGLDQVGGLRPTVPPLLTRTAQGPLDPQAGTVGDPFSLDRDMPDAFWADDIDRGRTAASD
ncbi:MAG: TIGR03936 family radical SAM-associated protein [Actinomycetota bacterium]|nr:TIGR03936 family radical SAM-associated protein [Actinomycetota bacterium]